MPTLCLSLNPNILPLSLFGQVHGEKKSKEPKDLKKSSSQLFFFSLNEKRQKEREADVHGQLIHFQCPLINLGSVLQNKEEGGH